MAEKNYLFRKIGFVNGIMCLLVVFLHSYNIERYELAATGVAPILEFFVSKTLGNLAVPIFFFISGILFFRNYNWHKVLEKLKSRFHTLFIPYILWNFIYYAAFLVLVLCPISNKFMDTKEITFNLSELVNAVLFHTYHNSFWFVGQLMIFVLIAPIVYLVIKRKVGILVVPIMLAMMNKTHTIPFFFTEIITDSLVYWVLGGWLSIHKAEILSVKSKWKHLFLYGTVCLLVARFIYEYSDAWTKITVVSDILLFINVCFLWFAFDSLSVFKVFDWMRYSFFIYALHPLIVDTIKKGFFAFFPANSSSFALFNYFLSGMGGLLICYMTAKVLEHILPRMTSVLCGGRKIDKD